MWCRFIENFDWIKRKSKCTTISIRISRLCYSAVGNNHVKLLITEDFLWQSGFVVEHIRKCRSFTQIKEINWIIQILNRHIYWFSHLASSYRHHQYWWLSNKSKICLFIFIDNQNASEFEVNKQPTEKPLEKRFNKKRLHWIF